MYADVDVTSIMNQTTREISLDIPLELRHFKIALFN